MAAERARLEPKEKAFLNRRLRQWKLSHFSAESVISGHNSPAEVQAMPYFYFRYGANGRRTCTLEPMEKAFLNRRLRRWKLSHFSAESIISGHNSPDEVQATPYFYFRYGANGQIGRAHV